MIALGQLPEDRHFSTEDLDLLAVLAGYAAMALENANLYHSVETKALELEHLKAYTENIIESINVAVLALDLGGRITSCNRAFEALYQHNPPADHRSCGRRSSCRRTLSLPFGSVRKAGLGIRALLPSIFSS